MATPSDEDFGFASEDEAAFEKLSSQAVVESGRKHQRNESNPVYPEFPPVKIAKFEHTTDETEMLLDLANNILVTKFKIPSFRLKQAQAITRILSGDSAVVVFPTGLSHKIDASRTASTDWSVGGGKSLCYQVPGVCFKLLDRTRGDRAPDAGGVTLVVSDSLGHIFVLTTTFG
jgi:hypothetical protein